VCGFAGWLRGARGAPPDPRIVAAMADALRHRGPDDAGEYHDDVVALGFRRLSIIDLTGGHQPLANEDGSVQVVMNGEIYGYRDLRAELERRGHALRTQSDTEVLVHGYEEWGLEGLLERLNGMFAFALWDRRRVTLHLVRDRLGVKPLYWTAAPEGVAFASEVQALRALPWLRPSLDPEALRYFLALSYVPAPLSIFREVRKLEPGCRLVVRDGEASHRRWWTPPTPRRVDAAREPGLLARELHERLEDAVRLQMVADVPVGLFLSSGLDSSALCALYVPHAASGAETFTVGFAEPGFSELDGARRVAERFGVRNTSAVVAPPDEAALRALVRAYGEPFADSSSVNVLRLAALARERVKVALSGDGGDEILGGYETYLASRVAPWIALAPAALRRAAVSVLRRTAPPGLGKVPLRMKLELFLRHAARDPVAAHGAWRRIFDARELAAVLDPAWQDAGFEERAVARLHACLPADAELDPWNALMLVDVRAYLADDMLTKLDRATMRHGLEARVPFLDHRLVEWCLTAVPGRAKIDAFRTKKLLRDAFAGAIPEDVRGMRKAGFNAPLARWFLGPCGGLLERVLRDRGRDGAAWWTGPGEALRLLAEHRARRADHGHKLFSLLALALWREEEGRAWGVG
jgi:asparagine synthase (glutamine-hydrolysing)